MIMKRDTKEIYRISARLAAVEQKCDLILSQLSGLRVRDGLDELIDRLHRQARTMRRDCRR
jgi:hypothetical protein